MKLVVIGCTHSGTAAIKKSKELYSDIDITVYEKNDNISFLSCGIALYIEKTVEDPKGLFYSSPDELKSMGVNTKMLHEILNVDFDKKVLKVKNLKTNEIFEDSYDKLLISTGSWPIIPDIEGIDSKNILLSKNFNHSNEIINKSKNSENITVIGAGYIGVELAEAFEKLGKKVTLIDAQKRILNKYLDEEITDIAEESMINKGINLRLDETVMKFEVDDKGSVKKVITDKNSYDSDMIILCIGFKPNTNLFKNKLKMMENGAIIVDEYMHTNVKDVYAAGDACAVKYNPTNTYEYIPLATNAVRMGTLVAFNLFEDKIIYKGTQGTSGIKIYDNKIASTGLNESMAKIKGIDIETTIIKENNRPEFMPTYSELLLKLIYDKKSKIILGAQIISKEDLTQSINTISVFIQNKMKVDDLAFIDFFFQPNFNKPWNFLNSVGLNSI